MAVILAAAAVAGIASGLYSAYSSYQAGKAQEELMEKQAEAQEDTAIFNYKTYIETSSSDYIDKLYDMSRDYSTSIYQVQQQVKAAKAEFNSTQGASIYNASSSYYQDVKNEISNQYDYAIDSMTSAHDTNLYRTNIAYIDAGEQNHQEFLNNMKRAEANLEGSTALNKIQTTQNVVSNLGSAATTAVDYYYKHIATPTVTPTGGA